MEAEGQVALNSGRLPGAQRGPALELGCWLTCVRVGPTEFGRFSETADETVGASGADSGCNWLADFNPHAARKTRLEQTRPIVDSASDSPSDSFELHL